MNLIGSGFSSHPQSKTGRLVAVDGAGTGRTSRTRASRDGSRLAAATETVAAKIRRNRDTGSFRAMGEGERGKVALRE